MNVVVIDDDRALLRSLEIHLSDQGHKVRCFDDLESARRYIEQTRDIDVLFLDYLMPLGTGDQLLRDLRGKLSDSCRTVMITGHSEPFNSYTALQALGVRTILSKPLDLDQVCRLVD